MKSCCTSCECYKETENGKCVSCSHIKVKKQPIPLHLKPRKKTGELELFKKLDKERGNKCELCGTVINFFSVSHFHHKKSKGLFPKLRLDPDNIIKICMSCHNKIHGH